MRRKGIHRRPLPFSRSLASEFEVPGRLMLALHPNYQTHFPERRGVPIPALLSKAMVRNKTGFEGAVDEHEMIDGSCTTGSTYYFSPAIQRT